MVRRIVCDTSITVTWLLDDEEHPVATSLFNLIEKGATVEVPSLWFYEIGNTLNMCLRRGRLNLSQKNEAIKLLSRLPVNSHDVSSLEHLNSLISIAQKHQLTVYDAAYIVLAAREALPLATLDKAMHKAAVEEGVEIFNA